LAEGLHVPVVVANPLRARSSRNLGRAELCTVLAIALIAACPDGVLQAAPKPAESPLEPFPEEPKLAVRRSDRTLNPYGREPH
jgi:hypothetical protein